MKRKKTGTRVTVFTAFLLPAALLLILFAAHSSGSYAQPDRKNVITLKVMSINVRHNSDIWEERFPLIADEIVRLAPDLIGLQEIEIGSNQTKVLLDLVRERAGDTLKYHAYDRLKTGAYMIQGEGIGILSRFEIMKKGYADLEYGRPVVGARVKITDDFAVDIFNTHLHNHGGDSLKLEQAKKVIEFVAKRDSGLITFLTGDMNSQDDSKTIEHLVDNSFIDTFKKLHGGDTARIGNTAPILLSKSNLPQDPRSRIDYVFVKIPPAYSGRVKTVDSVVCFKNHRADGLYPSDHLGVMTTFEIEL